MNEKEKELVASNLVIAFYSAVEPRPPYFGPEKRRRAKPIEGLDLRNPSISPAEVLDTYRHFLKLLEK
jgi:hypothetical protein